MIFNTLYHNFISFLPDYSALNVLLNVTLLGLLCILLSLYLWRPRKFGTPDWHAAVLEVSPVAKLVVAQTDNIISSNAAAEHLFGYTKAEIIGFKIHELIPDCDLNVCKSHTHQHPNINLCGKRKDQSKFPAEIWVNPLQLDKPLTLVVVVDLTAQKFQEHQFQTAVAEAEAAATAKDNFLALLSHELRTPLTPAIMLLESLEQTTVVKTIKRNIEIEANLINDLLDLSRLLKGKLILQLTPIDLHSAIANACEFCEYDMAAKRQCLKRDLLATPPYIQADVTRLRQILWNIIGNAVRYTPEGGMITISTKIIDAAICEVSVRDTGIGMSAQTLSKIFRAFEQGERLLTEGRGGLGLGLSISKSLMELHHGTIEASSHGLNTGSCFTLRFKLASEPLTVLDTAPPGPIEDQDFRSSPERKCISCWWRTIW